MSLLLWTALALAAEPESVTAVQAIEWAQPFALTEAHTYGMRGDKPSIDAGWILQLTVEAGMGRARAVDTPVLYVGEFPARVLNPSESATCLIVWAPKTTALDQTPIFFGERTLPERVDAESGRAQREAALADGATHTPGETAKALAAVTIEEVWAAAQARIEACSP